MLIGNYLKLAFRHLLKSRETSVINLGGLIVGFTCALLIFLFAKNQLSFDNWNSQKDNTYRVLTIDEALGVSSNLVGITMPAIGPAMKTELSQVKETTRISYSGRNLVEYNDLPLYTENCAYVENSIFNVFDLELLAGNKETVLLDPNTAVLTESFAKKVFGVEDPMGKTFEIDNSTNMQVVGIVKDLPTNTHLRFDLLASLVPTEADSSTRQFLSTWRSIAITTYAVLEPDASEETTEADMEALIRKNDVGENFSVTLQPLNDVHLSSTGILFDNFNFAKTDLNYVYTLLMVGLFVILIATFNFMNLSTARSANRAKEVGMRKVLGAYKPQLVVQFLSEAILLCTIAMLVSLLAVGLLSSYLDFGIADNLLVYLLSDGTTVIGIFSITMGIGVLAGFYPAFFLSGFQALKVLRGNFKTGKSGVWLRRSLVIIQFTASVTMIIGTVVVGRQLNYIKSIDKGFSEEQVITLSLSDQTVQQKAEAMKNELLQQRGVLSAAYSSSMPGRGFGRRGIRPEGSDPDDVWIVSVMSVNEDYFPLMGMEIVKGRNYSKDFPADEQQSLIINEAAAAALGWDEPIGKKIGYGPAERTVVGVVKNFHFANMRHKIEPIIIPYNPNATSTLSVKIDASQTKEVLAAMESTWKTMLPAHPYEYTFFDEEFGRQYESDEEFAGLIQNFTWLSIFIACLGLFGLSTFTAEQKVKEIGIRKVLGASVQGIVFLLSQEFLKLVVVACLIAVPIAWYSMDGWLEGFAYRIELKWWFFAAAAGAAVLISVLTVSYQSIKAAIRNPAGSLRTE
ncbi:MAG: FtsX-like permease family protein [Imperialibacter sp.]|uniref:ABC transporter permease n=1 Tax=Imperialibacter sp. TaxID=2038411 RepID=UPI0032F0738E